MENKVSEFVRNYIKNTGNYDINGTMQQYKKSNNFKNSASNKKTDNDKTKIEHEITDFCTNIYIGKSSQNLFVYVIKTFNLLIDTYCAQKNIPRNKILFLPKGGLILKLTIEKIINDVLTVNLNNMYRKQYEQYYQKSDMDFVIMIDINLTEYDKIWNEIINLTYYGLYLIRENINDNLYLYFDYHKYSQRYQKYLLRILRNNLNEKIKNKNLSDDMYKISFICKIIYDDNWNEEPCPYDYIKVDNCRKMDTYIYIDRDTNNVVESFPQKIGDFQNEMRAMPISINTTIDFTTDNKFTTDNNLYRDKFSLVRMKNIFGLYYVDDTDALIKSIRPKGELVDIVISHKDTTILSKFDSSIHIQKIKIGTYEFESINLEYILLDLENILFIKNTHTYPWNDIKYEKRLYRYLSLVIIDILLIIKDKSNNDIDALTMLIEFVKVNIDLPIEFPELDKYQHLIFFMKYLQKLNSSEFDTKNVELYKEYVKIVHKNFDMMIKILELLNNDDIAKSERSNTVIFKDGGYMKKNNDHLKLIGGGKKHDTSAQKMRDIIKQPLFNIVDIDVNISNIFVDIIKGLLGTYKNGKNIVQIYTNRAGKEIYNSTTDTEYMLYYDETTEMKVRKPLINYYEQILALSYASYISEYLCFLITHKNMNINTWSTQNNNNLSELGWNDHDTESKRLYRNELTNSFSIKHLDEFCNELNHLYKRCVVNLIHKIQNKLNDTIFEKNSQTSYNDVKNLMFATDHFEVEPLTKENEYEFIFHHWKIRIIEYIINNKEHILDSKKKELETPHVFKKLIRSLINSCIELTLDELSTESNGSPYSPNATGFFSWMYLYPRDSKNPAQKYGSCITYTYLECYILFRLFELPNFVHLNLENRNNHYVHPYWKLTQKYLVYNTFSHWTTKWNRVNESLNRIDIIFRNSKPVNKQYNFVTQKKDCFVALLAPAFDNYIQFVNINSNDELVDKNNKIKKMEDLLETIINKYDAL